MKTFLFILIKSIVLSILLSNNTINKHNLTEIENIIHEISKPDYDMVLHISKHLSKKFYLPHSPDLAAKYAGNPYPVIKKALIKVSPFLSDSEFDSYIIPLLHDKDQTVVLETIIAVGNRRNPFYETALYNVYKQYPENESVLLCLISAYSNFKSEKASDFISSFYNPDNVTTTTLVLGSLGKTRTEHSAKILVDLFTNSSDWEKIGIIQTMSYFRENKTIENFLINILAKKDDIFYPHAIQTAGELEFVNFYKQIQNSLKSNNQIIRNSAIFATSFFCKLNDVPILLKYITNNFSDNTDQLIYTSIERICSIYTFDEILRELSSSDHPAIVAAQLGNIGDESSVEVLTELLNNDDPINRIAAINSLKTIGGEKAVANLIGRLPESSPLEFIYLAKMLKQMIDESTISADTVLKALDKPFNHEKYVLFKSLSGDEDVLFEYYNLLRSESTRFRLAAITFAGSFCKYNLITDELKYILQTGSIPERYYCVSALLEMSKEKKDIARFLKKYLAQEKNPIIKKLSKTKK